MVAKRLVLTLLCLGFFACATNKLSEPNPKSIDYEKRFALMVCLGSAFSDPAAQLDFNRAANGYMERSDIGIEQMEEIRSLTQVWLNKDYPSKHGGQVQSAKCLDFYHSDQLTKILD